MGNRGYSFDSYTKSPQYRRSGSNSPGYLIDSRSRNNSNGISPSAKGRRRSYSVDGRESSDPWGWFEDFESPSLQKAMMNATETNSDRNFPLVRFTSL